jgi:hypothetical protein
MVAVAVTIIAIFAEEEGTAASAADALMGGTRTAGVIKFDGIRAQGRQRSRRQLVAKAGTQLLGLAMQAEERPIRLRETDDEGVLTLRPIDVAVGVATLRAVVDQGDDPSTIRGRFIRHLCSSFLQSMPDRGDPTGGVGLSLVWRGQRLRR